MKSAIASALAGLAASVCLPGCQGVAEMNRYQVPPSAQTAKLRVLMAPVSNGWVRAIEKCGGLGNVKNIAGWSIYDQAWPRVDMLDAARFRDDRNVKEALIAAGAEMRVEAAAYRDALGRTNECISRVAFTPLAGAQYEARFEWPDQTCRLYVVKLEAGLDGGVKRFVAPDLRSLNAECR